MMESLIEQTNALFLSAKPQAPFPAFSPYGMVPTSIPVLRIEADPPDKTAFNRGYFYRTVLTLGLIIGSGSLAFSNLKKWWPSTQNIQQQETVSSPGTSQRSFSLPMWICSILEVAFFATLIVLQFNGNANAKELSGSLISGVSVSLFILLAYRASRYIDW
jgi:hypothetical protein